MDTAVEATHSSIFDLFFHASFVVQLVMVGLIAASIWSWAINLEKTFSLRRARRSINRFEELFWSGRSLDEIESAVSKQKPICSAALFVAAMHEWRRSFQTGASALVGLSSRIEKSLNVAISREVEKLENNLLGLATISSVAPFVGLFGTVWGIMVSFRSIAMAQNTSLAIVAPGIAEALLATAVGLFAAIPALIAYNVMQSDVSKLQARMESFADELSAILSRQIELHSSEKKAKS